MFLQGSAILGGPEKDGNEKSCRTGSIPPPPPPQNDMPTINSQCLWRCPEVIDAVLLLQLDLPPTAIRCSTSQIRAIPRALKFIKACSESALTPIELAKLMTSNPAPQKKRVDVPLQVKNFAALETESGLPSSSKKTIQPPLPSSINDGLKQAIKWIEAADYLLWKQLECLIENPDDLNKVYAYIESILSKLKSLRGGDCCLIPGGFREDRELGRTYFVFVVYRRPDGSAPHQDAALLEGNTRNGSSEEAFFVGIGGRTFDVAVASASGCGSEFRSYSIDDTNSMGAIVRDSLTVFENVIGERLLHSSFWFMVLRMLLVPSQTNGHCLYTLLLPHLNEVPLLHNWSAPPMRSNWTFSDTADCSVKPGFAVKEGDAGDAENNGTTISCDIFMSGPVVSLQRSSHGHPTGPLRAIQPSSKLAGAWQAVKGLRTHGSAAAVARACLHFMLKVQGLSNLEVQAAFIFVQWGLCRLLESNIARSPSVLSVGSKISTCEYGEGNSFSRVHALVIDGARQGLARMASEVAWRHAEALVGASCLSNGILGCQSEELPIQEKHLCLINATLQQLARLQELKLPLQAQGFGAGSNALHPLAFSSSVLALGDTTGDKKRGNVRRYRSPCEFPMLGHLRVDISVPDGLEGKETPTNFLLPVDLSGCAVLPKSICCVVRRLRATVDACFILENQSEKLKNTYAFRFHLIAHLLLKVIPLPLPSGGYGSAAVGDDNRELAESGGHKSMTKCFWESSQVSRSTQIECLRLLHLLSRQFFVCAFSIPNSRYTDALRITTMAAMCCIGDRIARFIAHDDPSSFSLFYTGLADGPSKAFGFSIKAFKDESNFLLYTDPALSVARSQVLDYFRGLMNKIPQENELFKWEDSHALGLGDRRFLDLLALRWGFDRGSPHSELLFTGQRSELKELFPEFVFIRNMVFMFKALLIPTARALPALRRWKLSDSELVWKAGTPGKGFVVTAFDGLELFCAVENRQKEEEFYDKERQRQQQQLQYKQNPFHRFLSSLLGSSESPRAPPSGADPNLLLADNILNSDNAGGAGGKRQADIQVYTEDDVLHIKRLPTFGGRLLPQDSELLLQFLTAPYLRIPLVLQFFACNSRVECLTVPALQEVLLSILFEPWRMQENEEKFLPRQIPPPGLDHLSTPLGLLFNELSLSPEVLLTSLGELLELALEKDGGGLRAQTGLLTLFVLRVVSYVLGYIRFLLRHSMYWHAGWRGHIIPDSVAAGPQCCRNGPLYAENGVDSVNRVCRLEGCNREHITVAGQENENTKHRINGQGNILDRSFNEMNNDEPISGCGFSSAVRGLSISDVLGKRLTDAELRLSEKISEEVIPLLRRRLRHAEENSDTLSACRIHAHLLLAYRDVVWDQFNPTIVTNILSSLLFVFVHYKMRVEAPSSTNAAAAASAAASAVSNVVTASVVGDGGTAAAAAVNAAAAASQLHGEDGEAVSGQSLGIPDAELLQLLQQHRLMLIRWLELNPQHASEVLEQANKAVTLTASMHAPADSSKQLEEPQLLPLSARKWKQTATLGISGRFTPSVLNEDSVTENKELSTRRSEKSSPIYTKASEMAARATKAVSGIQRLWKGKQNSARSESGSSFAVDYEDWLREELGSEIEINLQIGDLSLRQNPMELLGEWANDFGDFRDLFGLVSSATPIQSATVSASSNRRWHRLMGRGYELHHWQPSPGYINDRLISTWFPRPYKVGSSICLEPEERWVCATVDWIIERFYFNCSVFAQPEPKLAGLPAAAALFNASAESAAMAFNNAKNALIGKVGGYKLGNENAEEKSQFIVKGNESSWKEEGVSRSGTQHLNDHGNMMRFCVRVPFDTGDVEKSAAAASAAAACELPLLEAAAPLSLEAFDTVLEAEVKRRQEEDTGVAAALLSGGVETAVAAATAVAEIANFRAIAKEGGLLAVLSAVATARTDTGQTSVFWKELVILRNPRVLFVFDIIECGRRIYRQLCFSSSVRMSMDRAGTKRLLCVPTAAPQSDRLSMYAEVEEGVGSPGYSIAIGSTRAGHVSGWLPFGAASAAAGSFAATACSSDEETKHHLEEQELFIQQQAGFLIPWQPSLMVTRKLSEAVGEEIYLPARILKGLIPFALVEAYEFWQRGSTGLICGYQKPAFAARALTRSLLYICLIHETDKVPDPANADAVAGVYRIPLGSSSEVRNLVHGAEGAGPLNGKAMSHMRQGLPEQFGNSVGSVSERQALDQWHQQQLQEATVALRKLGLSRPFESHEDFCADSKVEEGKQIGIHSQVQILVNLLNTDCSSPLGLLRSSLLRVESLSHILMWADALRMPNNWSDFEAITPGNLSSVEMPRLGLSFRVHVQPQKQRPQADSSDSTGQTESASSRLQQQKQLVHGSLKFVCEQHSGIFLLCGEVLRSPLAARLLRGISPSLLLTNDEGELFLLIAASNKPRRVIAPLPVTSSQGNSANLGYDGVDKKPKSSAAYTAAASFAAAAAAGGAHLLQLLGANMMMPSDDVESVLSQRVDTVLQLVAPAVLFDPSDESWLRAFGSYPHFLYGIHSSRCFLFIPTVIAGVYLFLLRYLSRQYDECFRLCDSLSLSDNSATDSYGCSNSTRSSGGCAAGDESQLWLMLNSLQLSPDRHPDAVSVRLRLWLVAHRQGKTAQLYTSQRADGIDLAKLDHREEVAFAAAVSGASCPTAAAAVGAAAAAAAAGCRRREKRRWSKGFGLGFLMPRTRKGSSADAQAALTAARLHRLQTCLVWDLKLDICSYVDRNAFVSASCKLTVDEELEILRLFPSASTNHSIMNRITILSVLQSAKGTKKSLKGGAKSLTDDAVDTLGSLTRFYSLYDGNDSKWAFESFKATDNVTDKVLLMLNDKENTKVRLSVPQVPHIDDFDSHLDTSALQPPGATETLQELFTSAASGSLGSLLLRNNLDAESDGVRGVQALQFISTILDRGLRIRDFLQLYALLTNAAAINVFPGEAARLWGSIFVRLLPPWDWKASRAFSTLQLLLVNPIAAETFPQFSNEKTQRMRLANFGLMMRSQEPVQKLQQEIYNAFQRLQQEGLLRLPAIHAPGSTRRLPNGIILPSAASWRLRAFFPLRCNSHRCSSRMLRPVDGRKYAEHVLAAARAPGIAPQGSGGGTAAAAAAAEAVAATFGQDGEAGRIQLQQVRMAAATAASKVKLTASMIHNFGTCPLEAIISNGINIVWESASELEHLGGNFINPEDIDLPFEIESHPAASTPIGRSTITRFRNEVKAHGKKLLSEKIPCLEGFRRSEIADMLTSARTLSSRVSVLAALKERLHAAFSADAILVEGSIRLLHAITNRMPIPLICKRRGLSPCAYCVTKNATTSGSQEQASEYSRCIQSQTEPSSNKNVDDLGLASKDPGSANDCLLMLHVCSALEFGRECGTEPTIFFEDLIPLAMHEGGESLLSRINPILDEESISDAFSLLSGVMLAVNRRAAVGKCLHEAVGLMQLLKKFSSQARAAAQQLPATSNEDLRGGSITKAALKEVLSQAVPSMHLKAQALADILTARRHYMKDCNLRSNSVIGSGVPLPTIGREHACANGCVWTYDPRFLVFEFAYSILLRSSQVLMVRRFQEDVQAGNSRCEQLIMGAGKTTVIAPLLALLLSDGTALVTEVVPTALLQFTWTVLRERFSAIIRKGVLTFNFSRNDCCSMELYVQLLQARDSGSVIVTTPTSIKSLFLKGLILLNTLDPVNSGADGLKSSFRIPTVAKSSSQLKKIHHQIGKFLRLQKLDSDEATSVLASPGELTEAQLRACRRELQFCLLSLEIFSGGVVIIDEIDTILQPLKSELHWPIGQKFPLDFTLPSGYSILCSGSFPQVRDSSCPEASFGTGPRAITGRRQPGEDAEVHGSASIEACRQFNNSHDDNYAKTPWEPLHDLWSEGEGVRWSIAWHILDALFFFYCDKMYVPLTKSADAWSLLKQIKAVIQLGLRQKTLQRTPHLLLLQPEFYTQSLLPLFVHWTSIGLQAQKLVEVSSDIARKFLSMPPAQASLCLQERNLLYKDVIQSIEVLPEHSVKALNLSRDWLHTLLPHVLQKVHRVNFGVLNAAEAVKIQGSQPWTPRTRLLLAVPFTGKDTPSLASEFAHPDVVIGLTIMSYRLQGLRPTDLFTALDELRERFENTYGPPATRKPALEFAAWIEASGGFVRGSHRRRELNFEWVKDLKQMTTEVEQSAHCLLSSTNTLQPPNVGNPTDDCLVNLASAKLIGMDYKEKHGKTIFEQELQKQRLQILPLGSIDFADPETARCLFFLLSKQPMVIASYLFRLVFPPLLEHATYQLSASGQEIGGGMVFPIRLGFSGTPSDLLPVEMGVCHYEPGTDGKLLQLLTSTSVCKVEVLPAIWDIQLLLNLVAKQNPPVHALIDSGALFCGLNNFEVAAALLQRGLHYFEAVIFLDEHDRQMALLRNGWKVVRLQQCGVSLEKRFTFFDHVHTTGQDIRQAADAVAFLTISKDMCFRDFAQGAWRMRAIGKGQSLRILLPPEVAELLTKHARVVGAVAQDGSLFPAVNMPPSSSNKFGITEQQQQNLTAQPQTYLDLYDHFYDMHIEQRVEGELGLDIQTCLFSYFDQRLALRQLCGWLVIRQITAESLQQRLLIKQNMENVWRKAAFTKLREQHLDVGSDPPVPHLVKCLDTFREVVDYSIPSHVPVSYQLSDHFRQLASAHKTVYSLELQGIRQISSVSSIPNTADAAFKAARAASMAGPEGVAFRIAEVNRLLSFVEEYEKSLQEQKKGSAFSTSCTDLYGFDPAKMEGLEAEVEQEQEEEEEKEQEQEVEQEQQVERIPEVEEAASVKFSRTNEEVKPWPLEALEQSASKNVFNEEQAAAAAAAAASVCGFYSAASFTVASVLQQKLQQLQLSKADGATRTMPFPAYMLISENFFKSEWCSTSLRRIKNVIIVMEWVTELHQVMQQRDIFEEKTTTRRKKSNGSHDNQHRRFSGISLALQQFIEDSFAQFTPNSSLPLSNLREFLSVVKIPPCGVADGFDYAARLLAATVCRRRFLNKQRKQQQEIINKLKSHAPKNNPVSGGTNDDWEATAPLTGQQNNKYDFNSDALVKKPGMKLNPKNPLSDLILSTQNEEERLKENDAILEEIFGSMALGSTTQKKEFFDEKAIKKSSDALDGLFESSVSITPTLVSSNTTQHSTTDERFSNTIYGDPITMEELLEAMSGLPLFSEDCRRLFVLLSLQEAEGIRAAIHAQQAQGNTVCGQLAEKPKFTVALHNLCANFKILDASEQLKSTYERVSNAIGLQHQTAQACCRFINSCVDYSSGQISLLKLLLSTVPGPERMQWFLAIRRCRRRREIENQLQQRDRPEILGGGQVPVQRLFVTSDHDLRLSFWAARAQLRECLKARKMTAAEAFRLMDVLKRGELSYSQLATGLRWLGVKLSKRQDQAVITCSFFGNSGSLSVTEHEFSLAVGDMQIERNDDIFPNEYITRSLEPHVKNFQFSFPMNFHIDELPPLGLVERVRFRLVMHTSFQKIWEGKLHVASDFDVFGNAGNPNKHRLTVYVDNDSAVFSIWAPDQLEGKKRGLMKKNRERICLGCYICAGTDMSKAITAFQQSGKGGNDGLGPSTLELLPQVLEITDPTVSGLANCPEIQKVIDAFLPYPSFFRPFWREASSRSSKVTRSTSMIAASTSGSMKGAQAGFLTLWEPVPPSPLFAAVGIVATCGSGETPAPGCIRCVPVKWLQGFGVSKQMSYNAPGRGERGFSLWQVGKMGLLGAAFHGPDNQLTRGGIRWGDFVSTEFRLSLPKAEINVASRAIFEQLPESNTKQLRSISNLDLTDPFCNDDSLEKGQDDKEIIMRQASACIPHAIPKSAPGW